MNHLMLLLICLMSITRTRTLTLHDGFHLAHQQAPPSPCHEKYEFDCGVGELSSRPRCIPHYWMCDNIYDCTSGADEFGCMFIHHCDVGDLRCPSGDCYLAHQRCDGVQNCLDGNDELGCTPTATYKLPVGGSPVSVVVDPISGKLSQVTSTSNDRITERKSGQQQLKAEAEPIVDSQVEGSHVSSLLLAFLFIMFMVLALFITRWALQRYPNTASRVDHTLKEFNRNVIQPRLMQRSSPSRVNITSPRNRNLLRKSDDEHRPRTATAHGHCYEHGYFACFKCQHSGKRILAKLSEAIRSYRTIEST